MKGYNEMAESVLGRRDRYVMKRRRQMRKITTTISCFCLCGLLGIGVWKSGIYNAPQTESIAEHDIIREAPTGHSSEVQASIIEPVAENAGIVTATLTPSADNSSSEELQVSLDNDFFKPLDLLTENELYEKAGTYLFAEAPEGFTFESAAYSDGGYGALWTKGMDELSWCIRDLCASDEQLITSVEDKENYDMSLYSIPLCDSVPMELIQIVSNPIFLCG